MGQDICLSTEKAVAALQYNAVSPERNFEKPVLNLAVSNDVLAITL